MGQNNLNRAIFCCNVNAQLFQAENLLNSKLEIEKIHNRVEAAANIKSLNKEKSGHWSAVVLFSPEVNVEDTHSYKDGEGYKQHCEKEIFAK